MTVLGGWFFGLLVTSGMKDGWKKTVVGIIVALVFGFGVGGLLTLEHIAEDDGWNNGHCVCGGSWELFDVEKGRKNSSTVYYYLCDECNDLFTSHSFKKSVDK